ncbi:fimbrial biogenesis outer membrane usher protein [Sphingomonas sp. CGMCC 1.13654]|uniref:Fimbrial biogenesis outer membrane usher protein n=1 Tax=Sphingomonas chungangi TaxID=2683589 RepID=A0A838L5Z9_9SPHN|nr:fimbria/pilus outer membrane usher protein [Sphingomonas chungangi]MBA2934771.1 fimbrial biogenesis outer membrane usher protein [Sphingomonas chungangi]MVW58082.1 fimbria/pilus outer membrane usher protein [Sphingomonas chungangi]
MLRRFLFLLLALAAAGTRPACAAALPAFEAATTADQPLFVELVLNGQAGGDIVPMRVANGHELVDAAALRKAGLTVAGDGPVDVSQIKGVQSTYDAAGQTLNLNVSPDMLPTNHISAYARKQVQTIADLGAMLNYDAYVQTGDGVTTASLWTEQRVFGPFGTISNNGTLRTGTGLKTGYLRYDTRYRYVDENHALAFTAGDLITQSLPWTTSVRLGGLQIARDYQVRPDLITTPLPSFAGKAAVPSAVDLFVDGYRQQSADVQPGRFVLDNMPVVNGAGEATIVTTDAVGRQIATTIPFYVSSTLLKPGLLDVSGEVGFLRRGYGLKNFDYGALTASGTIRRGLTQTITVEVHGEVTKRLALGGAGIVFAPGRFGTLNVSAATSRSEGRQGTQWTVGYSYTARRFSISAEHDQRRAGYRDLGSFDLANYSGTKRSDRVIATVNIPHQGSIGAAFIDGMTLGHEHTRIASVSYSRPIGRFASLFVSADHDFVQHSTSAQLRLIIPFGRNSVSGGVTHDRGRGTLAQVDYARSVPTDGGFGVNATLAGDDQGRIYGQGTATYRAETVEVQAGGSFTPGQRSGWVGATGSIVLMDKSVFAANQVNDAFAIVSTGGIANVPVSYENQPLGTTDKNGHLFVPQVTSYHVGRFAIDTLNLSADHMADAVEKHVSLRQGTGAIVHMPVRFVRNATVTLVGRDGKVLAAGGRVERAGKPDSEIGWDGIAFLEDIATQTDLAVTNRDGSACRAHVTLPADAKALAQIGPVPCV